MRDVWWSTNLYNLSHEKRTRITGDKKVHCEDRSQRLAFRHGRACVYEAKEVPTDVVCRVSDARKSSSSSRNVCLCRPGHAGSVANQVVLHLGFTARTDSACCAHGLQRNSVEKDEEDDRAAMTVGMRKHSACTFIPDTR